MKLHALLIAGLLLALAGSAWAVPQTEPPQGRPAGPAPAAQVCLGDLPLAAQSAISASLGRDDEAYHLQPAPGGFQAANPGQGLEIAWSAEGVRIRAGVGGDDRDNFWSLRLQAWGYGEAWQEAPHAQPQAQANRLEYRRGSLVEWYANGPLGLEQGFTLQAPPAGRESGEALTLALACSGGLRAVQQGDGLALSGAERLVRLRYGGLASADATGRPLPAWLELRDGLVLLRVDDRQALYPLVIDPLIQGSKLLPASEQTEAYLGRSVSLSADGNTALVGAPWVDVGGNANQGAAYVFYRSGTSWVQVYQLVAEDGEAWDRFGYSVALNAYGNTALVGAYCDTFDAEWCQGSAYVFSRSGMTWSQQAKLVAADGEAIDYFGSSAALSEDGNIAAVGAPGDDVDSISDQGSVYLFARSGTYWSQQQTLFPIYGEPYDQFGQSVALSADGNTVLGGSPGAGEDDRGAAYLFARFDSSWNIFFLQASNGAAGDRLGAAVALSADGTTALVSTPYTDAGEQGDQGSAYVFTGSGNSWYSQQAQLLATDGVGGDYFGWSAALSADGNTALIGAIYKDIGSNVDQGAVYSFTRSGTAWSQQARLAASDGAQWDDFGYAVALSADGNTALAGASYDDPGVQADQGSAYVFAGGGASWSQQERLVAWGEGGEGSRFGYAVALSADGNTALVGAPNDDVSFKNNQGSAYVFARSGALWSQQARLIASDGAAEDEFGWVVTLSADGNTALIGVPFDDVGDHESQGSAYIFARSGTSWGQQAHLFAPDGETSIRFGYAVALSADGNTALVGSPDENVSGNFFQGSAYIFARSGTSWSQQARLISLDGAAQDSFGSAVALNADGNIALVGAPRDDIGYNYNQGSAYVFARSGMSWSQQAHVFASGGWQDDHFGNAVALSADAYTALIGAQGMHDYLDSAYVFTRSGALWSEQAKLLPFVRTANNWFGDSVALSADGNTALIGAPRDDVGYSEDNGSAYVFARSGTSWSQQTQLVAWDGASYDYFGAPALSADGDTVLIGAYSDCIGGDENKGSAYIFDWQDLIYLPAVFR
jgi:hypothetical protein